jgi:TrmH family RNA methyltransferase
VLGGDFMITSPRNPRLNEVRSLRRRRERREVGLTTIEGPFLLREAVDGGADIVEVFALPGDEDAQAAALEARATLTMVAAEALPRIASTLNPRGPVAVIEIPATPVIKPVDSVLLWDVADPGNAGTIIRTAAAFGFQVLATPEAVDLWSPKVLRSGVGGHFRTPVVQGLGSLDEVIESGLTPYATAADGVYVENVDLSDPSPLVFIIGNEAHGIPSSVTNRTTTLALEMPGGTESLNAAVTGAVFMYLRMSNR